VECRDFDVSAHCSHCPDRARNMAGIYISKVHERLVCKICGILNIFRKQQIEAQESLIRDGTRKQLNEQLIWKVIVFPFSFW
jgi:hypothetical protein